MTKDAKEHAEQDTEPITFTAEEYFSNPEAVLDVARRDGAARVLGWDGELQMTVSTLTADIPDYEAKYKELHAAVERLHMLVVDNRLLAGQVRNETQARQALFEVTDLLSTMRDI